MVGSEEETYSTVFASLNHPIRRKILRILSAGSASFSDLQKTFMIESSHLTYHLETLRNLLLKSQDGKYSLSSLGEAAASMMTQVEEPPKRPLHHWLPSRKWKLLVVAMFIGLILLSAFFISKYQDLNRLSADYSNLIENHELLQKAFAESLGFENGVFTYGYAENSTVATALEIAVEDGAWIRLSKELPWGNDLDRYCIYNPASNSTLEIGITFRVPSQPVGAFMVIQMMPEDWKDYSNFGFYAIYAPGGARVTENGTSSIILPSRGRYTIMLGAPAVWNATNHYTVNYTLSLHVKGKEGPMPFFAENRTRGFGFMYSFDEYPWLNRWNDP